MNVFVLALAIGGWLLVVHALVNALLLRRPPAARDVSEAVSLLVPARDEEQRIGACVSALLAQEHLRDSEILVLDDESSDATAAVVRAVGGDRVQLLHGSAPPPGWLGKPHACRQLADAARGNVLVFVDADVTVAPDGVARAVQQLRGGGLALVSPYPRQLTGSWLELLTQPLLQWSLLTFLPLRVAERPSSPASMTAANGQLLVVDATAYDRAGGHASVRGQVVEDVALARAVKASGGRASVTDGTRLAYCRMYDGPRALVDGYAKSLAVAFGSPAGAAVTATALCLLYVVPWALVPVTPTAWVAAAAGPAGRLVSALRTGGRPAVAAVLHPLSVLAFVSLVVVALHRRLRGDVTWKRRTVA
jgi:Glycosyl transferase family 2